MIKDGENSVENSHVMRITEDIIEITRTVASEKIDNSSCGSSQNDEGGELKNKNHEDSSRNSSDNESEMDHKELKNKNHEDSSRNSSDNESEIDHKELKNKNHEDSSRNSSDNESEIDHKKLKNKNHEDSSRNSSDNESEIDHKELKNKNLGIGIPEKSTESNNLQDISDIERDKSSSAHIFQRDIDMIKSKSGLEDLPYREINSRHKLNNETSAKNMVLSSRESSLKNKLSNEELSEKISSGSSIVNEMIRGEKGKLAKDEVLGVSSETTIKSEKEKSKEPEAMLRIKTDKLSNINNAGNNHTSHIIDANQMYPDYSKNQQKDVSLNTYNSTDDTGKNNIWKSEDEEDSIHQTSRVGSDTEASTSDSASIVGRGEANINFEETTDYQTSRIGTDYSDEDVFDTTSLISRDDDGVGHSDKQAFISRDSREQRSFSSSSEFSNDSDKEPVGITDILTFNDQIDNNFNPYEEMLMNIGEVSDDHYLSNDERPSRSGFESDSSYKTGNFSEHTHRSQILESASVAESSAYTSGGNFTSSVSESEGQQHYHSEDSAENFTCEGSRKFFTRNRFTVFDSDSDSSEESLFDNSNHDYV